MDDKCGGCSRAVKSTQTGLQCNLCSLWFHARCAEVSDKLSSFLESEEGQKSN